MHLPAHFREERVPVLHEAMRRSRLAILVTAGPEGFEASHVPLLLDPDPAPLGTLLGHLARGNPQAGRAGSEVEALAILTGPDAYVSPSWYATKAETGTVVPTWNYVAVHAHGRLRFFEDPQRLLALVSRLTEAHEGGRALPWRVSDAPADFIQAQLRGITGFEMAIARLEGKWKLSQNRSAPDRAGVVDGLTREGGEVAAAVADLMKATDGG